MLRRSLLLRLILFSLVGGITIFVTLPVTLYIPLSYFRLWPFDVISIDAWAQGRAHKIIRESLRRRDDGVLFIEQTDALKSLMRESPHLEFAVFDMGANHLIDGSSRELEAMVKSEDGFDVGGFPFHLTRGSNLGGFGSSRPAQTPVGPIRVAVYGAQFHAWEDLPYQIGDLPIVTNIVAYGPVVLSIVAISAFTLSRGLSPLRKVAARVSAIHLKSLNQRIPIAGVPSEVRPLVDALNQMLARVDSGVASQKRFAANSAHELRTPIAVLRARVNRLENSRLKFEIVRDVRRIQTIAEQLLVIAREDARAGADSEIADLEQAARAVVMDYSPISLDLGREIAFEAASAHPPLVFCSDWALQCVIRNLVENAVRAEPNGGIVLVRVLEQGVVEVIDHGEGVRPEDREAIFEPFWRKSDLTPGAGLGLAIARELIGRYRGNIWVEDTAGGGATFKISWPPAGSAANQRVSVENPAKVERSRIRPSASG